MMTMHSSNPYLKNPHYVAPLDRLMRWWNGRKEAVKFRHEIEQYEQIKRAVDEILYSYEREWDNG